MRTHERDEQDKVDTFEEVADMQDLLERHRALKKKKAAPASVSKNFGTASFCDRFLGRKVRIRTR